jgi:hypothetical protein
MNDEPNQSKNHRQKEGLPPSNQPTNRQIDQYTSHWRCSQNRAVDSCPICTIHYKGGAVILTIKGGKEIG